MDGDMDPKKWRSYATRRIDVSADERLSQGAAGNDDSMRMILDLDGQAEMPAFSIAQPWFDHLFSSVHIATVEISQAGRCGAMATPCHAVALLIPQSTDAQKAFKARVNHATLAAQPMPLDGKGRREVAPFPLTMQTFFGRHTFSFGSSRRSEIVLTDGLATQHLHLHFEMHTALLLLTDTSNIGTWISTESSGPQLLRQRTWPVLSTTSIVLGDTQQYRFELRLAEDQRDTDAFLTMFRRYTVSLELSLSLCIKPLASIRDPQLMYEGLYLRLHHVGPAEYERINTCLRLSDARLFAVKSISEQSISRHPAQITSISRRTQPGVEADLLRSLHHVSGTLPPPRCLSADVLRSRTLSASWMLSHTAMSCTLPPSSSPMVAWPGS